MRDQHQRLLRLEFLIQKPMHALHRLVIHAGERLVEDEEWRSFHERSQEEDEGLVAGRQRRERLVQQRRSEARVVQSCEEVGDGVRLRRCRFPVAKDRFEAGRNRLCDSSGVSVYRDLMARELSRGLTS